MMWSCARPLGDDYAKDWDGSGDVAPGEAPRVLFESPDGAEAHAAWKLLQRHGYRTMWCPGPQPASTCSLCDSGRCELVDEADAVVSALDLHESRCGAVARALDAVGGTKPVVVVAPRASVPQWEAELPHCRVVAGPLSSKVLVRSLSVARSAAPEEASTQAG